MQLDGVNDLETILTDMRRKLDTGEAEHYSGAVYGVDWEDGKGEYMVTITVTRPDEPTAYDMIKDGEAR